MDMTAASAHGLCRPSFPPVLLVFVLLGGPAPLFAQPKSAVLARAELKPPTAGEAARRYPWTRRAEGYEPLAARLAPPAGCTRVAARPGSYAHWLRHLPLLPAGTPVRSYRGKKILAADDPRLAAVVDLDVGSRDRQQCADTIMRLRGEYLHSAGRAGRAAFRWAGGERFSFKQWAAGLRPVKEGRRWRFEAKARPSRGYGSFRRYLGYLFSWTGSMHMQGEPRVKKLEQARAGDFFIKGGSPGHAVVILDICEEASGGRRALIGQGFMPAQDLHLMRDAAGSPWFRLDPSQPLATPFWRPFTWRELRRFRF